MKHWVAKKNLIFIITFLTFQIKTKLTNTLVNNNKTLFEQRSYLFLKMNSILKRVFRYYLAVYKY